MEKIYSGSTYKDVSTLYYIKNKKKYTKKITQRKFLWYFCILKKQGLQHKDLLLDLKDSGLIKHIKKDENPIYLRVYCVYNNSKWDSSDSIAVLEEFHSAGIKTFEEDVKLHDRYIIDNDIPLEDNHLIAHFDIETDDRKPGVQAGRDRIVSIALVERDGTEHYWSWDSERRILEEAFAVMSKFTILTSWNGADFDWVALKIRAEHNNVKFPLDDVQHLDLLAWFKKAVEAGMLEERPQDFKLATVCKQYLGMEKTEGVEAGGGNIWDLFTNKAKLLKEYNIQDCFLLKSLDETLGIVDQCVKQSIITKSFVGGVRQKKMPGICSSSELIDKFLLTTARTLHMRLSNKKNNAKKPSVKVITRIRDKENIGEYKYTIKPKEMNYPGGRCLCKSTGLKNKVVSWDFKGYYSSLMRTFNIGPDTLMLIQDLRDVEANQRPHIPLIKSPYTHINERVWDNFLNVLEDEDYEFTILTETISGFNFPVEIKKFEFILDSRVKSKETMHFLWELQQLIKKLWKSYGDKLTIKSESFLGGFFKFDVVSHKRGCKLIISKPNQCYFRNDFDSIVRIALQKCTDERDVWKLLQKQWLENGGSKTDVEFTRMNSDNLAWKLLGNIMYGQGGNPFSRIYHIAVAMSITISGQVATEWTRAFFTRYGLDVVYMDTDSNYVYDEHYTTIRESKFQKVFDKNYHKNLWNFILKTFHVPLKDNCIILEREKRWFRMMFLSKKRYAGIVEDDGGKKVWKQVWRGIELRRTGTIAFAKKFHIAYYGMLFTPEMPKFESFLELVKETKEEFDKLTFTTPEEVELITKRQKVTMKPKDYLISNAHTDLMLRSEEAGKEIIVGSMLKFVLLLNSPKQKKNYAETVERYLANQGTMKIHTEQYWNKEIFKPLYLQLLSLFPDYPWGNFDSENLRMAKKIMNTCDNKLKTCRKIEDQIKAVNILGKNKRIMKVDALDYLNRYKEKWGSKEEVSELCDEWIEFWENNEFIERLYPKKR